MAATIGLLQLLGQNVRVDLGCLQGRVSQHLLYGSKGRVVFHEMSRKRVTQRVR